MSLTGSADPEQVDCDTIAIATILKPRPRVIDGFPVARALPTRERRLVGPFCFLDHLGPAELEPGHAMDVRPHPHIGLATVSYLFEGEVMHRDSLGSTQAIRPGAINWMNAGRGIVHSERTPEALRTTTSRLHLLQLWVALPQAEEESEPSFQHHPAGSLPELTLGDARIRVLAGRAFGLTSPVTTLSPLFFVEVSLPAGGSLELSDEYLERGAYVVEGGFSCGTQRIEAQDLAIFTADTRPVLVAQARTRLVLLGGTPLEAPRYIEWNFVSSSKARIERAKDDWRQGRFPKVPGDDKEFIPLP
jgi:redox-sensitive bicupin YhaK (pirin superfamily)